MTNVARVQFGAAAWYPRPEPPRAVMPLVVTCRGFDTNTLASDLAAHLAFALAWAQLGKTLLAYDSVPVEWPAVDGLAQRVGAVVMSIDFNQPAPEYPEGSYSPEPDEATVRVLVQQLVSARGADAAMLVDRRRDLVRELAPLAGPLGG